MFNFPKIKNDKRFSEYLSTYISNISIWENKDFWHKLYFVILEKKNIFYEKKRQAESTFNLNKMIKDLLKTTKPLSDMVISEKDMKLMALEELNFHMINMNVKSELAIDYLIDLAQKYFLS